MKISSLALLALITATRLFAGESGLTQTFQPLDGLGAGEIIIAPVMCHDFNAHSALPTDVALITARNIPPSNAPGPVDDINIASVEGISLTYTETSPDEGYITLDCRNMKTSDGSGYDELEIIGATLECLRRVAGNRLAKMPLKTELKTSGQEAIQKLVEKFIKHPKSKPFPWKTE